VPALTYSSQVILNTGATVSVPLKNTLKDAVVLEEVEKPTFKIEEIVSRLDRNYSNEQMAIGKFISEYYFSSFGEAISLFLPYTVGANLCVRPLDEKKS